MKKLNPLSTVNALEQGGIVLANSTSLFMNQSEKQKKYESDQLAFRFAQEILDYNSGL